MMKERDTEEVGRREMRNLVRWRHHKSYGTYKCLADCQCRTAPVVVREEDET